MQDEIHWNKEYCKLHPLVDTTWDQMVATHIVHCVLVLMTTTITQTLCIKFKQCLFIILKLITHM